jgi:hypothetical protein
VLNETEQRLLFMKPVERLEQIKWTTSDVPLADEIQFLLDHRPRRYWHVVLDEAQDLTPMELRMVGRRIRDGAVTVLGDLAQATGLWKYSTWDEVAAHLGCVDGFEIKELTLAYRVPREIMEVALPVLELTAPTIQPPIAFREGGRPEWSDVLRDDLITAVISRASERRAEGGTIAIIAPPGLLNALREELQDRDLEFGDGARGELAASIELIEPAMAKGLEFDHVYLVEPSMIVREGHEDRRFQELYVALTRATRTLSCVFSEPLRWPLTLAAGGNGSAVLSGVPAPAADGSVQPDAPRAEASTRLNGAPDSHTRPALAIDEAFVLARRRGVDTRIALARALLVAVSGADDSLIAAAILDSDRDDGAVQPLLKSAEEFGSDA